MQGPFKGTCVRPFKEPGMNLINLLLTVLVILLIVHFLGGFAMPAYRAQPYYLPGGVGLLVIVLLVFVLMRVV